MITDNEKQLVQELSSLMDETIKACYELYDYSYAAYKNFSTEEDNAIAEIISKREKYVDAIGELESKIECLIQNNGDFMLNCSIQLPYDYSEFRKKARSILRSVTELDMDSMQMMGTKMQKYKEETLKIRNKKNISAYISSGVDATAISHFDLKK